MPRPCASVSARGLLPDERDVLGRERAATVEAGPERLSAEVLHHEVGLSLGVDAVVVDPHDVLVAQLRGGPGLAVEAREARLFDERRVHELDRHVDAEREVDAEPDASHPALRDLLLEAVLPVERRAGGRRAGGRAPYGARAGGVAHALGEPQLQLAHVERLREEVVGAALERLDDVGLLLAPGEHQDVDVAPVRRGAEQATDVDAGQAGHVPVEDDEARRVRALQDLPRVVAVPRQYRLVAPGPQAALEDTRQLLVVVRRDYPHETNHTDASPWFRGAPSSFFATLLLR
ncbi:hypothetical protein BH11MYX4_BH11MYX4_38450 [soil metagenome]